MHPPPLCVHTWFKLWLEGSGWALEGDHAVGAKLNHQAFPYFDKLRPQCGHQTAWLGKHTLQHIQLGKVCKHALTYTLHGERTTLQDCISIGRNHHSTTACNPPHWKQAVQTASLLLLLPHPRRWHRESSLCSFPRSDGDYPLKGDFLRWIVRSHRCLTWRLAPGGSGSWRDSVSSWPDVPRRGRGTWDKGKDWAHMYKHMCVSVWMCGWVGVWVWVSVWMWVCGWVVWVSAGYICVGE